MNSRSVGVQIIMERVVAMSSESWLGRLGGGWGDYQVKNSR